MYNAQGHLQLMHVCCNPGVSKRSQTSNLPVSNTSQYNVSLVIASLILRSCQTRIVSHLTFSEVAAGGMDGV